MPDKSKLSVFADRGVRLVATCGTCKHSRFIGGRAWGECKLATYQHEKHTGTRQMPAHLAFVCPSHEAAGPHALDLGEYATLLRKP
jgi:hypothetical protein